MDVVRRIPLLLCVCVFFPAVLAKSELIKMEMCNKRRNGLKNVRIDFEYEHCDYELLITIGYEMP